MEHNDMTSVDWLAAGYTLRLGGVGMDRDEHRNRQTTFQTINSERKSMKEGEVVAYKDSCRFIMNGCGLVVDRDCDDQNFVWIRWAGEPQTNKVHVSDLRLV